MESTQQSAANSAPLPTSDIVEEQEAPASLTNNIPTETYDINQHTQPTMNITLEQQQQHQQQQQQQQNTSSTTATDSQVNLTTAAAVAEEVPMPVFSEWAQKQMEAAEKQQALEQEQTVNNSAQRKNNTNGNGKPAALKLRAKNYASPDCGAKIIASSAYTSNAGAVLSSSKDEYMLSLCGNRIWFVVELCEAIQAQKIDFANFELYSSSPQNFTVAVSKRFPTREWSNVVDLKPKTNVPYKVSIFIRIYLVNLYVSTSIATTRRNITVRYLCFVFSVLRNLRLSKLKIIPMRIWMISMMNIYLNRIP